MCTADPEFVELFRVKVDFAPDVPWDDAAVAEHAARLRDLGDVMTEASFWADRRGHDLVQADDVRQALQQRRRRSDLLEQQVREQILEGTMVVQTEGAAVGQVNALAVVQLGDLAFGRTIRTTAAVGVGRGLVRSIEREVRLADPSRQHRLTGGQNFTSTPLPARPWSPACPRVGRGMRSVPPG